MFYLCDCTFIKSDLNDFFVCVVVGVLLLGVLCIVKYCFVVCGLLGVVVVDGFVVLCNLLCVDIYVVGDGFV